MGSRGRPRDAGVDERVLNAAARLLENHGYAGLRIDDVSSASGVAKTTIYRRWPSLPRLAVDAVAHLVGDRSFTPSADPAQDLHRLGRLLLDSVTQGGETLLAIGLDIHRQDDDELRRRYREAMVDPPRELLLTALTRARDAGLLRAGFSVEDLVDSLLGGVIYRLLILRDTVTAEDVERLVDAILAPASE